MASFYTLLLLISSIISSVYSRSTQNNITAYNPLTYQQTLVSNNGVFELGFFTPDNTSANLYLGLWYGNKEAYNLLQVIWVANRNNPLKNSSGVVLTVSDNGDLVLLNGEKQSIWSSSIVAAGLDIKNNNSIAKITDDGNFVLYQDHVSNQVMWQSFDNPTDTLLPGMKLKVDQNVQVQELVSWSSVRNPSNGSFRLGVSPHNPPEMFVWDGDNKPYWRTGPWNGASFIGMDLRPSVLLDKFTYLNDTQGKVSFELVPPDDQSFLEHYVMQSDGVVVRNDWNDTSKNWTTVWKSLKSDCDIYGKCGEFGICNSKNQKKLCDCLEGYEPKNREEWEQRNWTSGCVRKKKLWCESANAQGKVDRFIKVKNVKVPDFAQLIASNGEDDCRTRCLRLCSCLAYAYLSLNGPYSCMIWNTSLIDVQVFTYAHIDLFIRTSQPGNSSKLKIILPVVLVTTAIFAFCVVYYCLWRRKHRRDWNRITRVEIPCEDEELEPEPVYPIEFKDLPLFTFDQLSSATNNFQERNKLGQGGFGPVYKGELEDGQEIAVKRLSKASGQGIEEFMNEVLLISKLQHRNLVRLLGCCVGEKMLVYEYMPNKSLDALLFDPVHKETLDWQKRFNIIEGICRGLLYLHRDSRLKVIHRDLKASNVLLDEDLNPKISDFGMARIFAQKEDQANTLRVVGTLGYMAPEYAMEGRFSEKSDVFSFGVLMLEIISSRKVKSFENDESLTLIGYAWKLWNEDDILSLVDQTISSPNIHCEVWKCIQIGLLCVQEFPEDRPTISDVISMLRCEISELPYPTQPGFIRRFISHEDSTGNSNLSVNLVSLTRIDGR